MQPQLYTKVKEQEANTHKNIRFDEQLEDMMTGEWEDDDTEDIIKMVEKPNGRSN